jgi:hypothetical protein
VLRRLVFKTRETGICIGMRLLQAKKQDNLK